jgi:RNA polymerase sigma factor (TIGR02999 family)
MLKADVTTLLQKWNHGDPAAGDQLAPLVYNNLRRAARRYLRRESTGQTLQSTDLVHEVYLRMVDQKRARWQDRAHFFAICAQMMRRILVDHARARHREKRGGGVTVLTLNEAIDAPRRKSVELIALDEALSALAELDPRQSQIVELRFFAGLAIDEAAEVLGISKATANRDWVTARAWLARELQKRGAG